KPGDGVRRWHDKREIAGRTERVFLPAPESKGLVFDDRSTYRETVYIFGEDRFGRVVQLRGIGNRIELLRAVKFVGRAVIIVSSTRGDDVEVAAACAPELNGDVAVLY